MGPVIRKEAPDNAATTTPAAASGDRLIASMGLNRGAFGVSGCATLVRVKGISVAQHNNARRL